MSIRYKGVFSPTVTPLDEKGRVDELEFVRQPNHLIDKAKGELKHLLAELGLYS